MSPPWEGFFVVVNLDIVQKTWEIERDDGKDMELLISLTDIKIKLNIEMYNSTLIKENSTIEQVPQEQLELLQEVGQKFKYDASKPWFY